MGINTNKARYIYFRITNNLFIKLFHMLITIFFHPLIICAYLATVVIRKKWSEILFYLIVAGIFIILENYIVRKIILRHSLKESILYHKLFSKGIIGIKHII